MRAHYTIVLLGTLASLLRTSLASGVMSRSGCLCTYDQPCWPSAAVFSQLESQLSQPLIYPRPTASPCYPPSHPSGNCTDVITNSNDGNWRASRPGSLELANFETYMFPNGTIDACFLNTTITGMCGQGSVPVIGVDARSVADIQAATAFAVEHNLKLVVKNTGHDFIGRSTARDAFVVWTHNMKNITYDAAFVPQGIPGDETYEAITFGAGVQWREAYLAANEHGRMMVGGASPGASVGAAGGWLAGGGHSVLLSPSYGLGVDNTLEISVVLSTGQHLITNEYQNSGLFWALRGGGGSTYGIVTSVTYRTYPAVPFKVWSYQANTTNSTVFPELFEGLLRYQTQFTDVGLGGYGGIINQGITFLYFGPNMTNETLTRTMQPWLNFVQSLAPYGVVSSSETYDFTWTDLIDQFVYTNGSGGGGYVLVTSRMLSRDTLANHTSQIAQALMNCSASFNTVAGGRVSQFGADFAGLNPAWRKAVIEAVCAAGWDEDTPSSGLRDTIQQFRGWIQAIHDAAPNDCAYLNEASPFEIDWQNAFFGVHYARLKSIKDKYDPYRLFVVKEGVGSEEWNEDLTCRS
ncbi:hypothetical protein EV363DRAFT_1337148 [Boletus edulis]|nr:hypothetical protein EV363DRAFT_1337148 [Boletus edulis]